MTLRRAIFSLFLLALALAPKQAAAAKPILVVTSASNPFSAYIPEILKAEGLNAYDTADLAQLSANSLNSYDVVILGGAPVSPAQVQVLTSWVTQGGNLIAIRPDAHLASLLGLSGPTGVMENKYLVVDASKKPGSGIVAEPIQYHGPADLYTLSGASDIARLCSGPETQTVHPAVILHQVGAGSAAAFTYDLARSIVLTRQGNPAWSAQERDGHRTIRSDDLFFGNAKADPQADWINLLKAEIPQADEQQRLLANLMLAMNRNKTPLPRFWYLPRGLKAVVVMTGDDHGTGGTTARFESLLAASEPGCSLQDWECVRGTSYVFPNTYIKDARKYVDDGFEIALHLNTNKLDYHGYAELDSYYKAQLAQFESAFPALPAPATNRNHAIVWSDYDSQPQVELSNGIRLDANYYYWPGSWINDRPGHFTGSAIPMRFMTASGKLVNVYQVVTQMTDESNQTYPYTVNTLLANALGPKGYYGVLTANMHTDAGNTDASKWAADVVNSAKSAKVPVITATQLLTWLDGRDTSSFDILSWSNQRLSFRITAGKGARNLRGMLPVNAGSAVLSGLSFEGAPVQYTTGIIKGVQYAMFPAATGSYVAEYAGMPAYSIAGGLLGASNPTAFTIALKGPVTATLHPDRYGNFQFTGLPPGEYILTTNNSNTTPTSQRIVIQNDSIGGVFFTRASSDFWNSQLGTALAICSVFGVAVVILVSLRRTRRIVHS